MIERNAHIILQQKMEMHFEELSDYIGVQNEIQELFYNQLLPAMEALFDKTVGDKNSIVIERMEIDCGMLTGNRWKEELVEKALHEIEAQFNQQSTKKGNSANASIDGFLFFLENGRLLWNSRIQSVKEMELSVSEHSLTKLEIVLLKSLLATNADAAERLVYNFTESFIRNILLQFAEIEKDLLETFDLLTRRPDLTEQQKRMAQTTLLKLSASDKPVSQSVLHELLENMKKNILSPKAKKTNAEVEYIYVHNAGLIILHPFLPALFSQLGLRINNEWKDESAQHEAVRVLEYLASGNYESDEFNLSLNKILCGMPLSTALLPAAVLSETMITECDDLLRQVIQHWSIIKNTSVDGFRETFLRRNGRLQQIGSGWQLHVERTGLDVLLDSLPWGIGTVVLPWMEDKIHVEW